MQPEKLSKQRDGLIDGISEVKGEGTPASVRLPACETSNTLVVIGYTGLKRAYLNISEEDALNRYLSEQWPEGWDEKTLADTRNLMTSFVFTDAFYVYDAGPG